LDYNLDAMAGFRCSAWLGGGLGRVLSFHHTFDLPARPKQIQNHLTNGIEPRLASAIGPVTLNLIAIAPYANTSNNVNVIEDPQQHV
jgi:hypothetical protein